MTPPKAIIFDMDGVLIQSSDSHDKAYRQVLAEFGVTDFSYAQVAGMRTNEAFSRLLAHLPSFTKEIAERCADKKSQIALQLLNDKTPIAPHCKDILSKLAKNFKLGLATSASQEKVRLFLRESGTAKLFSAILSGSEVVHAKPDPEIYIKILEALQVKPTEAWVIEDSPNGVKSARAAGIKVIGITGTCSESELQQYGASQVIQALIELGSTLDGLEFKRA